MNYTCKPFCLFCNQSILESFLLDTDYSVSNDVRCPRCDVWYNWVYEDDWIMRSITIPITDKISFYIDIADNIVKLYNWTRCIGSIFTSDNVDKYLNMTLPQIISKMKRILPFS